MTISLEIGKITVQRDKLLPQNLDSYELEISHFKRAIFEIHVEDNGKDSSFRGILDIRAGLLTITRRDGESDTETIIDLLADVYYRHTGIVDATAVNEREDGSVWVYRVEHPDKFLPFIHYLQKRGRITPTRRGL